MAYDKNGVAYPSVTTILGILDKPALIPWAARMTVEDLKDKQKEIIEAVRSGDRYALVDLLEKSGDAYKVQRNKAATTGTKVHKAIEQYTIMGIEPDFADTEEGHMVEEGFNAYLAWEEEHQVEFIHNELELFDTEVGYAGTTDGLCHIDGKLYLVDFKTSKAIYDEHKMQLSAYAQAWDKDERNDGTKYRLGILKLDKETGIPEFTDITAGHEQRVRAYNSLVDFYYKQKKRRLKKNPIVQELWGKKKAS